MKQRTAAFKCASSAMKAAGRNESVAPVGVHGNDLRRARQAADRVGQRPIDDRSHRAAVDVVPRGAESRHVARAIVYKLARVCGAPHVRSEPSAGECESAAPGPSRHVEPEQSAVQLHCHEPTAMELTSPARRRPTSVRKSPAGTKGAILRGAGQRVRVSGCSSPREHAALGRVERLRACGRAHVA